MKKGDFTRIDFPGAASTAALGINDRNQITGSYYCNPPTSAPMPSR